MIGFIVIDGVSSEDFGMVLSDAGSYGVAERDVNALSVAGKSGDLIFSNDRFKNVELSYPVVALRDFDKDYTDLMSFILSHEGYMRIEDSFNPEYFMQARYTGKTNPSKVTLDNKGVFTLTFDRKPQRWLKSGEKAYPYTSNGSIYNIARMTAKPLVRVYGTGTVGIGSNTITINSADEYTDIDCEIQNAYKGTTNCNGNITLNSGKFFELPSGKSGVTLGSGITKVEITPRWWNL